ncbi:MAG: hypothetical protein JWR52_829 [Marmoricola sp.]|nr:hypothetical protein [Marmoricola sp.]
MSEFQGFPEAALDFYDDLEMDNTKSYWEAHKAVYTESVKAPMTALTDALAAEFGTPKVFRPFRDVRFAKDKTPYKTNQGAFVAAGPACGWYVEISARGVRTGGGFYDASSTDLARVRTSIDSEATGKQLERILAKLRKAGFEIGGVKLKTTPRGYDAEHPRIDLLRHKSLTVGRSYGFEPVIHSPALVEVIRKDWRATRPLIEWVAERLGD